jgi:hypothetical protein
MIAPGLKSKLASTIAVISASVLPEREPGREGREKGVGGREVGVGGRVRKGRGRGREREREGEREGEREREREREIEGQRGGKSQIEQV